MTLSHPDFAFAIAALRDQQRNGTDTSKAQSELIEQFNAERFEPTHRSSDELDAAEQENA